MRIVTPELQIDHDDPFKHDLLGRRELAHSLQNLVTHIEGNAVIALNAPWGEGKTSFVKMWQALLAQNNIQSMYFDAFAHDYFEEPFVALVSEITHFLETHLRQEHPARQRVQKFKQRAATAGAQLLTWGAKVGVKAATLGVLKENDIEALQDIYGDLASGSSEVISKFIAQKLNSYQHDKASIQGFQKEFAAIASEIRQESHSPLILIIDELDRCKPTYALTLLEKVKHLFLVEDVVFVLVMHKQQLEEMVRCLYGHSIDATAYLQKFIHLEFRLPKNTAHLRGNDYDKYCKSLTETYNLKAWNHKDYFEEVILIWAKRFQLSLRELERCYANLAVFYASTQSQERPIARIVGLLAVLKIRFQSLYLKLKGQRCSVDDVVEELDLNNVPSDEEKFASGVIPALEYCLFSPEQFNALEEEHPALGFSSIYEDRNSIIPRICAKMDLYDIS